MAVDSADIVVIGAGVSGLSSAWFLARAGKDVVVIEKGTVGSEASGRNGGMISERVDEPPLIPMALESLNLWPTLDDELGYPIEFIQEGRLQVAVTEAEMGELLSERDVALRHGISVKVVDPAEIRDMVPGISDTPLLPTPNTAYSSHTCQTSVALPTAASAAPAMAAPATMTQRTSTRSISRAITIPARPETTNMTAMAPERWEMANDRSPARAFMYTDRL